MHVMYAQALSSQSMCAVHACLDNCGAGTLKRGAFELERGRPTREGGGGGGAAPRYVALAITLSGAWSVRPHSIGQVNTRTTAMWREHCNNAEKRR